MNTLLQAQIFFFVSSAGFFVLFVFAVIFFVYLVKIMRTVSRILLSIENDILKINNITHDIFVDIKESMLYRFLFGKKGKRLRE